MKIYVLASTSKTFYELRDPNSFWGFWFICRKAAQKQADICKGGVKILEFEILDSELFKRKKSNPRKGEPCVSTVKD